MAFKLIKNGDGNFKLLNLTNSGKFILTNISPSTTTTSTTTTTTTVTANCVFNGGSAVYTALT